MDKRSLTPSKITRAEEIWGMDVLAKVFSDINNRGGERPRNTMSGWSGTNTLPVCSFFLVTDSTNDFFSPE